jgi:protease-4
MIVFRLIANLILLLPRLLFRPRRAQGVLHVEIDGALPALSRRSFGKRARLSLGTLRETCDRARTDPRIEAVVVTLRHLASGSATAQSLRQILTSLKSGGKRVVVYLPNGGHARELYVGSISDRLLLGAGSSVGPLGFAATQAYVRDALDKVRVEAEVFARGTYKSAGETLVRREMSAEQREQIGRVLSAAHEEVSRALGEGRRSAPDTVAHWMDHGPWSARRAVSEGLADDVLYEDELGAALSTTSAQPAKLLPLTRYERSHAPLWKPLSAPKRIAVVEISGAIVTKRMGPLPAADERAIRRTLAQVRDDRHVCGVILAIDSRGGSALASERIYREAWLTAQKKPVVALMENVAASGGYMIAAAAQRIVAQPLTLTGSIGVVSARFVVPRLLETLGIRIEVVKRGEHADMLSPARQLTAGERAALDAHLDELYQRFVEIVANGRGRPLSDIEPLARGRVWVGRDALEVGLIDRLGGFDEALAELRSLVGGHGDGAVPFLAASARFPLGSGSKQPASEALLATWLERAAAAVSGSAALELAALSSHSEPAWLWCDHALAPA